MSPNGTVATLALTFASILCGGGCLSRISEQAWDFDEVELASHVAPLPAPSTAEETIARPLTNSIEPLRLSAIKDLQSLRPDQVLRLELEDILQTALRNNAVVRDDRQFLSPGNELLANPELTPSVFDSSIQQSGATGIDAALAAFDVQAAAGAQWGENSLTRSNGFITGGSPASDILVSESGSLYGRLDKPLASGATASLVHAWNYVPNNLAAQAFNSRFAGYLRAEFRQPLLAGRGREFTEIAGPISPANPNPGRGTVIARLDQELSVAEFESRIQLLIKQVHEAYLDLWLAHEIHQAQVKSAATAEELLNRVQGRADVGLDGGEAANRAYAEENVFDRKRMVDDALAQVLEAENRLRRLAGLPSSDGQLLVPASAPPLVQLIPDWDGVTSTAIQNRAELRQQRTRIHSLDLQCMAARSLTRPQLDLVAGAQVNGTGDEVVGGAADNSGALDSLLDPDEAGWNVGFELSMPLGFRLANARVRNYEQRLAKARAALAAQEAELTHELAHVFYEIDRTYAATATAAGRRDAARRRFLAVEADYEAGRTSLDLLLRTYVTVSDSERAYLESVVAYNKALIELTFRQGTILRDNAVVVADVDAAR